MDTQPEQDSEPEEDEAALRDWELSAIKPGDFFADKLGYARVVTVWRDSTSGELNFLTIGPGGESKIIDATAAHKLEVITDQSDESAQWKVVDYWAEATAIHREQERSHASYIVIRDEDLPPPGGMGRGDRAPCALPLGR